MLDNIDDPATMLAALRTELSEAREAIASYRDDARMRAAENARLRELLVRASKQHYREPDSDRMEFDCRGCGTRSRYGTEHMHDCLTIAIKRALAGAAVPAEAHVFGVGDIVSRTLTNGEVRTRARLGDDGRLLVRFGDFGDGGSWVHPRDLVLVRKATVK